MTFESHLAHDPNSESYQMERVDSLLSQFPVELQETWEDKITPYPLSEQIQMLEEALKERKKAPKLESESNLLLPEGVEIFQEFPDDVRDMIEYLKQSERRIEVGYGKAAHVITSPSQRDVCYKVLLPDEVLPLGTNDISKETDLQKDIWKNMNGKHGVTIPTVYGFIREDGTRAMTMELLNAASLRKIVERKAEEMPASFDQEKFFKAITLFVKELHRQGIYHRDLHGGNILVHRETGMPCLIDFGLSTNVGFDEEHAYRAQVVDDGQPKEIVLKSDESNLSDLKNKVGEYMRNNGGL